MKKAVIIALLGLVFSFAGHAAPFAKNIRFTQPDGTEIDLFGKGDEFYAEFETLDGYTVVFNPKTKAYHYAELSKDGNTLIPGKMIGKRDDPKKKGGAKKLRINKEAIKKQVQERSEKWEKGAGVNARWKQRKAARQQTTPGSVMASPSSTNASSAEGDSMMAPQSSGITGTKVGLCLLIDFDDDPATIPQAEIIDFCNGDSYEGYGNNGSVKKYFQDNSAGMLTYSNVVTVYIRIPNSLHPKSWYNDTSLDCGRQANLLIRDAIAIMKTLPNYTTEILPTFSDLAVDEYNGVVACNVFYAGGNGGVWAYGLWPHSWALCNVGPQELGNGKSIFRYQITNIESSLALGTFCHENGHMLCGLPDTYDYGYDSTGGTGQFCLMGFGGFCNNGLTPSQINAYFKTEAGWATTINLTSNDNLTASVSSSGADFNKFYRYQKPGVSTEYYLVENRQKAGHDAHIPGAGIAVWHIDELGDKDNQSTNYNSSHLNYEVSLMQADNQWHFQSPIYGWFLSMGGDKDLYYNGNEAADYSNRFDDLSSPGARWWDGTASMVNFREFSANGTTMTFLVLESSVLTVIGGSGSGVYTNGQQVDISADTPATGMTFDRWTGDTQYLADSNSANTTVTMSARDISLTATYKIQSGWYSLTVNNGTGSGMYSNGVKMKVRAIVPEGTVFNRWTGDTQCVDRVISATATVTMPAQNTVLTAICEDAPNGVVVVGWASSFIYYEPDWASLLGPVGSGKSTIAQLMYSPDDTKDSILPNGAGAVNDVVLDAITLTEGVDYEEWGIFSVNSAIRAGTNGYVYALIFQDDNVQPGDLYVAGPLAALVDGVVFPANNAQDVNVCADLGNGEAINGVNSAQVVGTMLTVNGGNGSGWYTNGQQVAIAADAPVIGKTFDQWIGDTQYLASASSASTTVTMPVQNVSLTATYVDVYYTLTVNSGTGSGTYTYGQQVAISADAPASMKVFERWAGATQVVASVGSASTTVTMPASNISVAATYQNLYALTVNNGTGDGSYTNGQRVAISADAPATGKAFDRWRGDTQVVDSVSSPSTMVTMPTQDATLTAIYNTETHYVSLTGGNVSPYTNWAMAATSIQPAVSAAASGEVVRVATGTYVLSSEISVPAGITVRGEGANCATIVDGNNAVRCFNLTGNAVVAEMTITRGYSGGSGSTGGGVLRGIVSNCTLSANSAYQSGGGAYGSTLYNCTLTGNSAGQFGGGAFYGALYNCTLSGNTAGYGYSGGAIYGTLYNCIIYPDSVQDGGTLNNCWTTDPKFVGDGDYSLRLDSPCIGKANPLTATTHDIRGFARDQLPDIGAFEYVLREGDHVLTIINGSYNSGRGAYTNGEQVVIAADAPATGKAFVRWAGDTQYVASVTSSNTTVTMPAQDVYLTATYEDAHYELTVNGGTGSGAYIYEQQVAISADSPPSGMSFYRWTGDTAYVNNSAYANAMVTMPAQPISLTATYRDTLTYETNLDNKITITSGYGVDVIIPDTINGLPVTRIGDGAFAGCTSLNSITIPDSVVRIGDGAFAGCTSLTSVTIPDSVIRIGGGAFAGCTSLSNAKIGNSVSSIGERTFNGCTGLTNVTFGSSVTFIGRCAFNNCVSLTSVTLPESITSIKRHAFQGCASLTKVYFMGDAPCVFFNAFAGSPVTGYRLADKTGYPPICPSYGTPPEWSYLGYVAGLGGGIPMDYFSILTGSAGVHGTVSPASMNVVFGDSADFVITANNYYRIATLTTNGTAVAGMSFDNGSTSTNFIWSDVQASGVLAATFIAQVTANGTPYSWLAGYGLTDDVLDQDSDGMNTWQEYIAGTDPTSAASVLKVVRTNLNVVTWSPVVDGRIYSVYWTTNLESKVFAPLATDIVYPQGIYTNTTPDSRVNQYEIRVQLVHSAQSPTNVIRSVNIAGYVQTTTPASNKFDIVSLAQFSTGSNSVHIQSLFENMSSLRSGTVLTNADRILTWDGLSYVTYGLYQSNSVGPFWMDSGDAWSDPAVPKVPANVQLSRGSAAWFQAAPGLPATNIVAGGDVILDQNFSVTLRGTLDFLSYPYSADININKLVVTNAYAGQVITNVDRIITWNGSSYTTYGLYQNNSVGPFWMASGAAWILPVLPKTPSSATVNLGKGFWYQTTNGTKTIGFSCIYTNVLR